MSVRVLVFGTFDDLHTGHLFFLESAKVFGDVLIVSVARDAHVRTLKHKEPFQDEQTRLQNIRLIPDVDEAFLSDEVLGSFQSVESVKPDLIVLGHDQDDLAHAFLQWSQTTGVNIQTIRVQKQSVEKDSYAFQTCTNCTCDH